MKKLILALTLTAGQGPLWAQTVADEYTRMLIMQQQHDYTIRETVVITDPERRQPPQTYKIEHYFDRQPKTTSELLLEE